MRKITLFLMLMVAIVTTAFSQTKIELTTEAGQPGYISTPHDHAVINPDSKWDKGGIAALIDGDPKTHFHTAWENVPTGPHYFQVDLGEVKAIDNFCFEYQARKDGGDDFPSQFVIKGSNNDSDYERISTVEFQMPNSASETNGKVFSSGNIECNKSYRYLRFEVTNTKSYNGAGYRTYFHAAEFNLYMITTQVYTVKYNYSCNGNVVATVSHEVVEGSTYPDLVSGLYGVTVNSTKPEGTVTADCQHNIDVTIEMPFEYYDSYEAVNEANGWYNLIMHSNWNTGDDAAKYRTYLGAGDETNLAWGTKRSLTNPGPDYYWAFVGNPITGFSVVNKSAEGKVLYSDGTENPVLLNKEGLENGYNTTWQIAGRKYDVSREGDYILEGAWFCLKYRDNWYMNANARTGDVNFWEDNDNGSAILAVKPLEINEAADYATYYSDNYVKKMPSTMGAEVYYVNKIEDGCAKFGEISGEVIPAHTGVVVKYVTESNVVYAPEITSKGTTAAITGNLLQGTTKKTLIEKEAGKAYYALGLTNGIGFYNAVNGKNENEFYNNAFKAYLEIDESTVPASSASLRFDFDGTTGIEEVEIRNEKEEIYDLTGRRVNEITKAGVYIVNGKKVLVK